MSSQFSVYTVLLFSIILLLLLIGFVYVYLFIGKKQRLMSHVKISETQMRARLKFRERMAKPIIKAAEYAGPTGIKYPFFSDKEKDERLIVSAGNPMDLRLESFYGLRFVLGLSALLFTILYVFLGLPFGLMMMVLLPLGGFFGPNIWLWLKARERQEQISATMPDFLDTVSVTLQAGVSLDGALRQVTKQLSGPLSEEIDRFSREIELGVPRRTAYENLLNRNYSKELKMLVTSLIQGSSLGVPVSQTFKIQADDLRAMRGFKAKEKAAKASPQITLVTTFFVAPAVFFLIIGMLILNVIYNPSAFGLDSFF
ncbi:type II secretion system F family protein [Pseudalkalibacillus berkeleyi]|uniref:Type II secretion system F family protein n=1 Tax=Pseudalkalibacillus berkeleyi TaxID=1069813 RepID=A0ABS9H627_9BACL|nr:type II secretion system F family protein [Pseudalkalibacillus berkeleyi]MCF6139556.1 type II secretion system F family protein [Pseudalkalibacillus berkeleyi]